MPGILPGDNPYGEDTFVASNQSQGEPTLNGTNEGKDTTLDSLLATANKLVTTYETVNKIFNPKETPTIAATNGNQVTTKPAPAVPSASNNNIWLYAVMGLGLLLVLLFAMRSR